MNKLETTRAFYARLVTSLAGVPADDMRLVEAFASVPRERFLGAGPWRAVTPAGYVEIPSDDPASLYQDFAIALLPEKHINNGQPSLHARCLAALRIKAGETLLHIGSGSGYYTALLAKLTGPDGAVIAYELDKGLAVRAAANLSEYPNVMVQNRSGAERPLPRCNVIYVNAGATDPLDVWLDSLLPGGRLLFPLTAAQGTGGMLLVTRTTEGGFAAGFVCLAAFIHCVGARNDETARGLAAAFKKGGLGNIQSLRRNTPPDGTCWLAGKHWWLSTGAAN